MGPSYPIFSGSSAGFSADLALPVEFPGRGGWRAQQARKIRVFGRLASRGVAAETRPDADVACRRRGWLRPSRWRLRSRRPEPETHTACTRLAPNSPIRVAQAPSDGSEPGPARPLRTESPGTWAR